MQKKTSSSLVFGLCEEGVVGFNFLQKSAFICGGGTIERLGENQYWKPEGNSKDTMPQSWLELGMVVQDGSTAAYADKEYSEKWTWGLPAALYHFSVQGNEFQTLEQGEAKQAASAEILGLPQLYTDNSSFAKTAPLNRDDLKTDFLKALAKRRSSREPTGGLVPLQSVARMLFSGLGITGTTKTAVVELPLSMTPSGGARNPYEAFLFARKIEGLEQGIYHYSAIDHSLGQIDSELPENFSTLVGNQEWANNMSGILILVANFERTMWKYDDPNAYRVVLIEAGHIGQNILLSATNDGLAACPTAALTHDILFEILKLPSRIVCAPIYAVAFGTL